MDRCSGQTVNMTTNTQTTKQIIAGKGVKNNNNKYLLHNYRVYIEKKNKVKLQ